MDIIVGLFVIVAGAATLRFFASPRTSRGLDFFAAGFLPYQDPASGWPQGVQEEDPVPWAWRSSTGEPDRDWEAAAGDGPELIEIDRGAALTARPVHQARMARGTATRVR